MSYVRKENFLARLSSAARNSEKQVLFGCYYFAIKLGMSRVCV
jgi:hypothetical protein